MARRRLGLLAPLLVATAAASTITRMAQMPVPSMGDYGLVRRAQLTTCGFASNVDCCQDQAPWFCPTEFGSCFTSNSYIGCCSRSGGCAPRATCYPHSSLRDCDPDVGGCTACTDPNLPFCATESNVVAHQYILYCASFQTFIERSYSLNPSEISRGSAEEAARTRSSSRSSSSRSSSSASPGTSGTSTGETSPTSTSPPTSGSGGSSTGAIVGGVVGGIALFVLIGVALFFGWQHYRKTHPGTSFKHLSSSSDSPYGWPSRSPAHAYAPVSGLGVPQAYNTPYDPASLNRNGSPSSTVWPRPYAADNYGDLQHAGYHALGPLRVLNAVTPGPTELETSSAYDAPISDSASHAGRPVSAELDGSQHPAAQADPAKDDAPVDLRASWGQH